MAWSSVLVSHDLPAVVSRTALFSRPHTISLLRFVLLFLAGASSSLTKRQTARGPAAARTPAASSSSSSPHDQTTATSSTASRDTSSYSDYPWRISYHDSLRDEHVDYNYPRSRLHFQRVRRTDVDKLWKRCGGPWPVRQTDDEYRSVDGEIHKPSCTVPKESEYGEEAVSAKEVFRPFQLQDGGKSRAERMWRTRMSKIVCWEWNSSGGKDTVSGENYVSFVRCSSGRRPSELCAGLRGGCSPSDSLIVVESSHVYELEFHSCRKRHEAILRVGVPFAQGKARGHTHHDIERFPLPAPPPLFPSSLLLPAFDFYHATTDTRAVQPAQPFTLGETFVFLIPLSEDRGIDGYLLEVLHKVVHFLKLEPGTKPAVAYVEEPGVESLFLRQSQTFT